LPAAIWWLAARRTRGALREVIWPVDPDRRMLCVLFAVPLVLPVIVALLFGVRIVSIWTIPAWFLLPIILLSPSTVAVSPLVARRMTALAMATTVASLIVAPLIALYFHYQNPEDGRPYYAAVSERITREWRAIVGRPLATVTGDYYVSMSPPFYSPDHPDSVPAQQFSLAPWVTPDRMALEGWALICRAEQRECMEHAAQAQVQNMRARRVEFAVTRRFLGLESATGRFVLVVVPPQSAAMRHRPRNGTSRA
jgi:hypothetical protein